MITRWMDINNFYRDLFIQGQGGQGSGEVWPTNQWTAKISVFYQ